MAFNFAFQPVDTTILNCEMLAAKRGSNATTSLWSKKSGVKPSSQNRDGARRAFPGKGALQALGIRRGTVRTIEKITGTMKLVAQAQLLGTTKRANETAGFFLNIKAIADKLPQGTPEADQTDKLLTVVVTSNRGLCGSLNTQLIRDVARAPESKEGSIVIVGDKGANSLEKRQELGSRVFASATPGKIPTFLDFVRIGELIAENQYDRVVFVYNKLITNNTFEISRIYLPSAKTILAKTDAIGFDFEEGQDELFVNFHEFALAAAAHYTFYQNAAAETLSRRNAMDGANKNCKELKLKLSIVYNKLRQALITTDLIEITTGTTAVEEMS